MGCRGKDPYDETIHRQASSRYRRRGGHGTGLCTPVRQRRRATDPHGHRHDRPGASDDRAAWSRADCSTHGVDLASEADIQRFAADICRQHPRLDVLINNAGIAYGEITHAFQGLSQENWLHFLSVNALSPLILAQALRPALAKGPGVILNVTSMASNVPATAYGVTKATLNAITFGMANAFAADGIRVNAVAPGIMQTPAAREQLSPETYARIQSQQLLNLRGTANDVAALAAFLASDDARFIDCEIVNCDAGNRVRGWRG
jgi:3-oxoacyl-[acyl-carrier protein] reductase